MNIFVLDLDPVKAAQMHCDQHVIKMITESCQLLSTAHWYEGDPPLLCMNPTHDFHPCAVWTRSSTANYLWLQALAIALCEEYHFRYGGRHLNAAVARALAACPPGVPHGGLTPFAIACNGITGGPVESYRAYYRRDKTWAKWTRREVPYWWRQA